MQDDTLDPLLGRTLADKFEILELLGSGAMGRVYKARHKALAKDVAIKVMLGLQRAHPDQARRFKAEARAASRLDHPNSVAILDFGEESQDGLLYIVMELIEGVDLQDTLEGDGPMDHLKVAWIMSQVFSALSAAHAAEVIHRDMKPGNIMLVEKQSEDGLIRDFVKVCDFGLAKILDAGASVVPLTAQGAVFGTPAYMSPEQARGDATDYSTDIYACGIVMYKMLTGRTPFKAESPTGVLLKHISEAPPPLAKHRDVDPKIQAIVSRCLEKKPEDRYPSAVAARDVLRALLQEEGHALPPAGATINPGEPTSVITSRKKTVAQRKPAPNRGKTGETMEVQDRTLLDAPKPLAEPSTLSDGRANTVYAATLDPAAAAAARSEEQTVLGTNFDPPSKAPAVRPVSRIPMSVIQEPSVQPWAIIPGALALLLALGLLGVLMTQDDSQTVEPIADATTTMQKEGSVAPLPVDRPVDAATVVSDAGTPDAGAGLPRLAPPAKIPAGRLKPSLRPRSLGNRPVPGSPQQKLSPPKPTGTPKGPVPASNAPLGLQLSLKKVRVVSGMSNMAAHRALVRHLDKVKACLHPIVGGLKLRASGQIMVSAKVSERGRLSKIEAKGLKNAATCVRQSFAPARIPAPDTGPAQLTFTLVYRMTE